MAKEALKDYRGLIYGYIETHPNGEVWAYDWRNFLVGKYIPSRGNYTYDFAGRIVSSGNTVVALIPPRN